MWDLLRLHSLPAKAQLDSANCPTGMTRSSWSPDCAFGLALVLTAFCKVSARGLCLKGGGVEEEWDLSSQFKNNMNSPGFTKSAFLESPGKELNLGTWSSLLSEAKV